MNAVEQVYGRTIAASVSSTRYFVDEKWKLLVGNRMRKLRRMAMPTTACSSCSPYYFSTSKHPLRTAWLPIALVAAILASPMAIDHISRLKEMISMTTGQGPDLATTEPARLTDEVLRMVNHSSESGMAIGREHTDVCIA